MIFNYVPFITNLIFLTTQITVMQTLCFYVVEVTDIDLMCILIMLLFVLQVERFKTGRGQYKKSMNQFSKPVIAVIEDRITPLVNAFDDDYGYAGMS